MCTAVTFKTLDHYFGRNMDFDFSYGDTVTITPRNFPFNFRHMPAMPSHFAMIGMACVQDDYPLYFEATNEKGLSMAGLNFPANARFGSFDSDKENVAPFEFIPWILGQCETVRDARERLDKLNLMKEDFSPRLPVSPLHWMIADRDECIVVESIESGLKVYDNPVGILTNSPTFDFHMMNLTHYMGLSKEDPENRFSDLVNLTPYSRGMGAVGLPGDLSSASRFVKAAFTRLNSVSGTSEYESVSQFFHILASVEQQKGCCKVGNEYEYTIYSSCCNTDKGIYYYRSYENSQIIGVDMHREDLDGSTLVSYPMVEKLNILIQN